MKKNKETIAKANPFKDWELHDLTLSDWDEVYDGLVELNAIYTKLSKSDQEKEIYLNLNLSKGCICASCDKGRLAYQKPINHLLGFTWNPEWEELYGESEEDATYNALASSVTDLIEENQFSLIDNELPWL